MKCRRGTISKSMFIFLYKSSSDWLNTVLGREILSRDFCRLSDIVSVESAVFHSSLRICLRTRDTMNSRLRLIYTTQCSIPSMPHKSSLTLKVFDQDWPFESEVWTGPPKIVVQISVVIRCCGWFSESIHRVLLHQCIKNPYLVIFFKSLNNKAVSEKI